MNNMQYEKILVLLNSFQLNDSTMAYLQSWTKLVETNAISERISQFPCMETPLNQCCLEGLRIPQGVATLIRGEGERFVVVSDFHGQSSHSFRSVSTVSSEIVDSSDFLASGWSAGETGVVKT